MFVHPVPTGSFSFHPLCKEKTLKTNPKLLVKMFPWLQLWKRYWSRVNLGERRREGGCQSCLLRVKTLVGH